MRPEARDRRPLDLYIRNQDGIGCRSGSASPASSSTSDATPIDEAQPSGLREFVRARGYHSLYFLRVQLDDPIKIGITHDPASRGSGLQNANWRRVSFDRLWCLPGQPIAARIEAALKPGHLPQHIRGEWYDVDPAEAARFVDETTERLGTRGITQAKIEQRFSHWARQRYSPREIVRPASAQEPKPDRRRAPS